MVISSEFFRVYKFFFNKTYENNSFSITVQGHWESKSAQKTIDKLNKLLEVRSLELHVNEVRKRGNQIC